MIETHSQEPPGTPPPHSGACSAFRICPTSGHLSPSPVAQCVSLPWAHAGVSDQPLTSLPHSLVSAQWLSEPGLVIGLLCPGWGHDCCPLGLPTVQLHPQGFVVATETSPQGCTSITHFTQASVGCPAQSLSPFPPLLGTASTGPGEHRTQRAQAGARMQQDSHSWGEGGVGRWGSHHSPQGSGQASA